MGTSPRRALTYAMAAPATISAATSTKKCGAPTKARSGCIGLGVPGRVGSRAGPDGTASPNDTAAVNPGASGRRGPRRGRRSAPAAGFRFHCAAGPDRFHWGDRGAPCRRRTPWPRPAGPPAGSFPGALSSPAVDDP